MVRAIWENGAALVVLASFVTWALGLARLVSSSRGMAIAGAMTVLVGLVPIGGVSAAGLVLSVSPSLSVAGATLWGALLFKRITGHDPLGDRGTKGLALVIMGVALPVYISFVGGMGPDVYSSGYGFTLWDLALGGSAVVMFTRGSRLSLVLLACLAVHAVGITGSSNIFDTLVDVPALPAAIAVLLRNAFPARGSLPNRPWL